MQFSKKVLLTCGLLTAAMVAVPSMLKPSSAQALPPQVIEELDLTAQQQSELEAIRENTRTQVQSLLTAEQQSALQASTDDGTPPHQAMRSLDLSDEQRQEIRSIMGDSREAVEGVLTEAQQQELRELMASRRGNREKGGKRGAIFEQLNLSAEQEAQITSIRENSRAQVEAVLTEDQLNTVRASLDSGEGFRQAMRTANLSDDQRTEIRSIMEASRESIDGVLTEDQRAQLQAAREEHRGNRRERPAAE